MLQATLWLAYPLLIFFGLHIMQPRYVAGLLFIVLLIRLRRKASIILSGFALLDWSILAGLLTLALMTALTNSELLLRLYPASVSFGTLSLFLRTLAAPPPMIERFARLSTPDLSPVIVRYTLRVTQVWCIFFVINGSIALYTALYASKEVWSLYNGLVSYMLMGAMFGGEWLIRRTILRNETQS